MIWNSWAEFFAMGGYALYVWGSAGVVFGVLALEVWLLRQRWRHSQRASLPPARAQSATPVMHIVKSDLPRADAHIDSDSAH